MKRRALNILDVMGNTGGIKEILVSLSDYLMEPISGLYFNMLETTAFYKIR